MDVLLDSCAWIEYLSASKKGEKVRKIVESSTLIVASTVNIAEIYKHLLDGTDIETANDAINEVLKRSVVVPLFLDASILAAELKHEHKMALGDALILATALVKKAKLVTFDSDFKGLENCEVL